MQNCPAELSVFNRCFAAKEDHVAIAFINLLRY
jgi:hypothetical protein